MTKQLKSAIVVLITMASMNSHAQKKAPAKAAKPTAESKSAKPSKQQTMDWIAGKMKEKLMGTRKFVSYSNGVFVYTKESMGYIFKNTVDLNKITGSSPEYSSEYSVKGTGLFFVEWGKDSNEVKNSLFIAGSNYNDDPEPFDFKTDDSLVERLKKAFTTLIEYNATKKDSGEAF